MSFVFSPEQDQLRDVARQALQTLLPPAPQPISSDTLAETTKTLAGLGLTGLLVPEDLGGSGGSLVDAALLAEQLGAHRAPGALVVTSLIAASALPLVAPSARTEIATRIVGGRPVAVLVDRDLHWPPESSGLAWGYAPECVVLAPSGAELVPIDGATFLPAATADLLIAVGYPQGGESGPPFVETTAGRLFLARLNVLMASLILGHAGAALDAAVEYAKHRAQYGAPVGSFQAVRHMCADMLVDVEASRAAAYGSAWMVESLRDERAGAVAKAWCSEAGVRVCETALQVLGGIGFTWENGLHEHLRAVHFAGASFMSTNGALDVVAAAGQWT